MTIYPLVMDPAYRHGSETPWGGHALRDRFRKETPDGITGESLEISTLPCHESHILNGEYRGKTLQDVFLLWKDKLTGKKDDRFPLLLKLLDAQQCLSVQVHPDDGYALTHEGKLGKNEAWYILDAVPGAKLVYGVDTHGEELDSVIKSGRLEECLHWVNVHPGDVYYIPSGTIHALGSGIQCYEIQESSDVTYRLWDWGRTGKDGKPRMLHTRQAIDVSNTDSLPAGGEQAENLCFDGKGRVLVDDPHFQLLSVDVEDEVTLPGGKMQFITATMPCTLRWGREEQSIVPYQSALVPADMTSMQIAGKGRILVSRAA